MAPNLASRYSLGGGKIFPSSYSLEFHFSTVLLGGFNTPVEIRNKKSHQIKYTATGSLLPVSSSQLPHPRSGHNGRLFSRQSGKVSSDRVRGLLSPRDLRRALPFFVTPPE